MKYILIIFIFLFALNPLFSQKDSSQKNTSQKDTFQFYNKTLNKNNFCIELGGKAILYSVGYERVILRAKKILLTGNVNLSYGGFAGFDDIIVPLGINILVGEKRNKLLLGLHGTNVFDFTPYPKTRKEREAYRADGKYKYDMTYHAPYRLPFIVSSLGIRRYFKNGNSISFAYTHLIYNFYGKLFFSEPDFVPWFGLSYNLNF